MFGVGLHFDLKDLLAVRRIAIPGATAQITVATLLGMLISSLFGWPLEGGFVFGLCLSVASTVVLTRVLVDNRALHTTTGHVAVGWLIVEDIFTVIVLVLLPIFFDAQNADGNIYLALGVVTLKFLGLMLAIFVLGARAIPWLFSKVAESGSQELFTLTVLVTALGISVGSAVFFDVSMALGAFLAGMVVGKSEFSQRAASEALPLRDAFAVLFFVSVGMLLDPTILLENYIILIATLAVVIVGKSLAAFVIVVLLGYPVKVALGVSVALAQIGEFSFILATLGNQLDILDPLATQLLVATAIFSITVNPVLYRLVPYADKWISSKPSLNCLLNARIRSQLPEGVIHAGSASNLPTHQAVIIGYGPIGKIVSRVLKENGIDSTIIELNLETTRRLSEEGISAVYGDAGKRETLISAGLDSAKILILSASSISDAEELVRLAREINPEIQIIARTAHIRELLRLRDSGCEAVYSGEGEVALAVVEEVLRNLGATSEQIERERRKTRRELARF